MSERSDEAIWDERYRSQSALWSGKPNPHLVTETDGLGPGRALDVGAGEGADAIWLAGRGWQVTAVDISTVALDRAEGHARAAGSDIAGRISWEHRDVTAWEPPRRSYDLVNAQYLHFPPDARKALFEHLAAAVAPGGTLLIVGHHPLDLHTPIPRPPLPELYFTGEDVTALLDAAAWTVITDVAAPRTVTGPDGSSVTIHDTVLRATLGP